MEREESGIDLTKQEDHDNMVIFRLGVCVIVINLIRLFEDSDIFKVLNIIAVFATLFSFAWFKLFLVDKFVHSFWLKLRMKKGFKCIYGYGVDEYFVLARMSFFTGFLFLLFTIVNSVNFLQGGIHLESVITEVCISCIVISTYCWQLHKYESAFSEVVNPFVASCIGLLVTAIFIWQSGKFLVFLLFFLYSFLICSNELTKAVKCLDWGDQVTVCIGDEMFNSEQQRFYLIFYSKSNIVMVLEEETQYKRRKVDGIESLSIAHKASDRVDGWEDLSPVYIKIIEKFMGLRIFKV